MEEWYPLLQTHLYKSKSSQEKTALSWDSLLRFVFYLFFNSSSFFKKSAFKDSCGV